MLKDNITLAIAIFGAIGTLVNWFYSFIRNKKNISISIPQLMHKSNNIYFFIVIENKSLLPISINQISLISNDSKFVFSQIAVKMFETTHTSGGVVTDRHKIFTIQFPVSLNGLCGTSGFLYLTLPEDVSETLPNNLSFEVATNRGLIKKKKLPYLIVPDLVKM